MTINLSNYAIKAMGFDSITQGDDLRATFTSVNVFEVKGVSVDSDACHSAAGSVAGADYYLSVGVSINAACKAAANIDFTDDEEGWKKQVRCQGPFVVICVGPTGVHTCTSGHVKTEQDGSKTTYDSFPEARKELLALEERAIPRLVSALTCVFSKKGRQVALKQVARESLARLEDGTPLRDFRFKGHLELQVAYKIEAGELGIRLSDAAELAIRLNPKVSKFIALGMAEEDQLKRFLYFFLALEIETHAEFGRLDHDAGVKTLLSMCQPPLPTTTALLSAQVQGLRNLYDRFAWCAACSWPHIDADDIAMFKILKQARDAIAHGSASEPPIGHSVLAEQLARKVLWGPSAA